MAGGESRFRWWIPGRSDLEKNDMVPPNWGVASSFHCKRVADPSMGLTICSFCGDTYLGLWAESLEWAGSLGSTRTGWSRSPSRI